MLIDYLNEFSDNQAVTVTGTGTKVIDSTNAGNAKLEELFFHTVRSNTFTSSDDETTLTIDTIVTAGDTFTIGDTVYTATADDTADAAGEFDVGSDVVDGVAKLIAAIDGTDNYNSANEYASTGTTSSLVKASGTLTISGVVVDGETVTITNGTLTDVYEFATDAAQTVTSGNIAVDISGGTTEASQGTLTMDTQPTAGDTTTIGIAGDLKVFTWVALGTADADGEIDIGANVAAAKVNFVAAINGTDAQNTASLYVSAAAFAGDDCVLTALVGGTVGDNIITTETFTAGTNVFDAGTLGTTNAGVDCPASEAVTALVAAEVASGTAEVVFADGAGDTVTVTADTAGIAGNLYATTETMANGAFATATLIGGDIIIPIVPKVGGTGKASTETFTAANNVFSAATLTSTTLQINLQTSATIAGTAPTTTLNGTVITLASSAAIPIAELNAGSEIFKIRVPEGALQYYGISYTVANGPFTAGNIDSFLNADVN